MLLGPVNGKYEVVAGRWAENKDHSRRGRAFKARILRVSYTLPRSFGQSGDLARGARTESCRMALTRKRVGLLSATSVTTAIGYVPWDLR